MVVVEYPNRAILIEAVDIYRDVMRPFILQNLRRVQGQPLIATVLTSLPVARAEQVKRQIDDGQKLEDILDVNDFPQLVQRNWKVISSAFGVHAHIQNIFWLIKAARNQASHPAHKQDLETEYTRTQLNLIGEALDNLNAPEEKKIVDSLREQLIYPPAATPAVDTPPTSALSTSDKPGTKNGTTRNSSQGLKSWREVIRPNQDIRLDTHEQAEFAADLQQVHDGRADTTQYGNPVSFFDHTYITPGIRSLLSKALQRLAGTGGDPVIQTKSGFGGGKTHTLIALYHLVRSVGALLNPPPGTTSQVSSEIGSIIQDAGYSEPPNELGKVAVLDGTYLSTTDSTLTENGDPLNTLWGVMAYQLDGQDGYDIIGEAARQGISPGSKELEDLFELVGPCVILIDEPVAYLRNLRSSTLESNYTFFHALTSSVNRSKNVVMVITLPESQAEAGGSGGEQVLASLEHLIGRMRDVWAPLATNESFEVVRRRLFENVIDTAARDQTCEAFIRMYSNNRNEYPQGVTELNYLERMKACYPIHPEIFDRLYSDWSSIPRFQRTRGVLRMMANCVSRLYLNSNSSPLIMPGDLPFSDSSLADEFNRLLPGEWEAVLTEVDSDNSRTDNIDKSNDRYSEVGGAARRIARTVFLGSASSGALRGIDTKQIHLGVVQPRHGYARYDEALNKMTGDLYYLYHSDGRYYFHAEENLNKVVSDRINNITSNRPIDEHIARQLEQARNRQSDILLYAGNTEAIPQTDSVRLVALPPAFSLTSRSAETDTATPQALEILEMRGSAPRFKRNMLVFLTGKRDEIRNLREETKKYLAWDSIVNGNTKLPNLKGDRLRQAKAEVASADTSVRSHLIRAYRWVMAPSQPDPQTTKYNFNHTQTDALSNGEIFLSAFNRLINDEALVNAIAPISLVSTLQQYIWNGENTKDHIKVDVLWDLFTNHVYLHRLRSRKVLDDCIRLGVEQQSFGYAAGHDGHNYIDLRYGEPIIGLGVVADAHLAGLLVNPEAAQMQKEAERAAVQEVEAGINEPIPFPYSPSTPVETDDDESPSSVATAIVRRVTARKTSKGNISLDDMNNIQNEIIRNLSGDGGDITVEITISADKSEGFTEGIIRSVRENSGHLGLEFNTDK